MSEPEFIAPGYQQPSKPISDMANYLSDLICNDPKIQEVCESIARRESKTEHWEPTDWEQNEDTPQYDLYWAYLSALHQQILAATIIQLGFKFTDK